MDFKATKDSLRVAASSQKKLVPLVDTQKRQEQKAKEAAEYRARILREKRHEKEESSPSMGREKAAIKASKAVRDNRNEQRKNGEGMATTAQCAFNLANILMVRLKLISIVAFSTSAVSLHIKTTKGGGTFGSTVRLCQSWRSWGDVCHRVVWFRVLEDLHPRGPGIEWRSATFAIL